MNKRKLIAYLMVAAVVGSCSATFAQTTESQAGLSTVLTINYTNPSDPNSSYVIRILPANKGPLCYPKGATGMKVLQGSPLMLTQTDLQNCGALPYWIQDSKGWLWPYGNLTQISNYGMTCYIDNSGHITCQ